MCVCACIMERNGAHLAFHWVAYICYNVIVTKSCHLFFTFSVCQLTGVSFSTCDRRRNYGFVCIHILWIDETATRQQIDYITFVTKLKASVCFCCVYFSIAFCFCKTGKKKKQTKLRIAIWCYFTLLCNLRQTLR